MPWLLLESFQISFLYIWLRKSCCALLLPVSLRSGLHAITSTDTSHAGTCLHNGHLTDWGLLAGLAISLKPCLCSQLAPACQPEPDLPAMLPHVWTQTP